jgi:hypothetical protein
VFVENIDEFANVAKTPRPTDLAPMQLISERAFKRCLRISELKRPTKTGAASNRTYSQLISGSGARERPRPFCSRVRPTSPQWA